MIGRLLFAVAAGVTIVPGLSGCASTPLSTAASMRVEVEVYKGPLAKEPEIQWADLVGLLAEAESALAVVGQAARDTMLVACDPRDLTRLTEMHEDIISAQQITITPLANACAWTDDVYKTERKDCVRQVRPGTAVESVRKTVKAARSSEEVARKATEDAGETAEAASKAAIAASRTADAASNAADPSQAKGSARQAMEAAAEAERQAAEVAEYARGGEETEAREAATRALDAASKAKEAARQALAGSEAQDAASRAEATASADKDAAAKAKATADAAKDIAAKAKATAEATKDAAAKAKDAATKANEAVSEARDAQSKTKKASEAKEAESKAESAASRAQEAASKAKAAQSAAEDAASESKDAELTALEAARTAKEATSKVQVAAGEIRDAASTARDAASKAASAVAKARGVEGKAKDASTPQASPCKSPRAQQIANKAATEAAEGYEDTRRVTLSNASKGLSKRHLARPSPPQPQADTEALQNILAEIARASQQFKLKASLWSEANVPYASESVHVRKVQITLTTMLGTYADRMGSKADTLLKQVRGNDRQELALSVSLRETNPPAYLKQFVWYYAGGDSVMQDLQASRTEETRARVRGVERLYADENWSNVNTVYASGQGTVRMALIKDDIGNWNLKSFDSDPSKLLDAYKNVGLAGVKVATDLAIKAGTGAGGAAAATQALEMAKKFALGAANVPAPTVGSRNIEQLHADTAKRLTALEDAMQNRAMALTAQIKKLTDSVKKGQAAAKAYDDAKASYDIEMNDLAQASADEKAYSSVRDQLDNDIAARPGSDELEAARAAAQKSLEDAQKRKAAASGKAAQAKAVMASNETERKQFENDSKMLDSAQRDREQLPTQAVDQAKLVLDGYQSVIDALESALVSDDTTGTQLNPTAKLTPKLK